MKSFNVSSSLHAKKRESVSVCVCVSWSVSVRARERERERERERRIIALTVLQWYEEIERQVEWKWKGSARTGAVEGTSSTFHFVRCTKQWQEYGC